LDLARDGAHLGLVARNQKKAEALAEGGRGGGARAPTDVSSQTCLCSTTSGASDSHSTGLGDEHPLSAVVRMILARLDMGNPQHGAGIIVRLATEPRVRRRHRGYFAVEDTQPLECLSSGAER